MVAGVSASPDLENHRARNLRGPGAISIDPPLTWIALAWTATLAIVVVAVRIGTSQNNLAFALTLMVLATLEVALFGIAVEVLNLETVGLLPKTAYQGWVTGTFIIAILPPVLAWA